MVLKVLRGIESEKVESGHYRSWLKRSVLYVLSGHTGKIVHTYHLSGVEYSSIILMGNEFIYLIGTNVTTIRMERPRVE